MTFSAVLHIGPMKTGSSSIQYWLDRNSDTLAGYGYYVPTRTLGRNHSRLARWADQASSSSLNGEDAERFQEFAADLECRSDPMNAVVISGEMMGQILVSKGQVSTLKSMLDPFVDKYLVVVYLRRQVELSLSRYSTALRHGEHRATLLGSVVDFENLLRLWSEVFGREAVRARIFDRSDLLNGDVVHDFAHVCDLPKVGFGEDVNDRNPSLRPEAQLLLADIIRRISALGVNGPISQFAAFEAVGKILTQNFTGRGILPTYSEVSEFYAQFTESNERIRRGWFPERVSLFSEDLSGFPQTAYEGPPMEARLDAALLALTGLIVGSASAVGVRPSARELRREGRQERRAATAARRSRRGLRPHSRESPIGDGVESQTEGQL